MYEHGYIHVCTCTCIYYIIYAIVHNNACVSYGSSSLEQLISELEEAVLDGLDEGRDGVVTVYQYISTH